MTNKTSPANRFTHPRPDELWITPLTLTLALILFITLCTGGCAKGKTPSTPVVPVLVAQAMVQPQPLFLKAVGTVEPIESVAIKAQVDGVLMGVGFVEGQDVAVGQRLFQIDARPFEAALKAAQAQLARDAAQAANATIQAKRYADLVKKDYVTQEQYETARTQAEMLVSTVKVDEAKVAEAQLNLDYTTIKAPIAGRTGSLLVKQGNVIQANNMPLVVINQMLPIRVSFSIPGSVLAQVREYGTKRPLEVRVTPSRNNSQKVVTGTLTFIDNTVGTETGTVTLKALFANEDGQLWPGQFVDTQLILAIEENALIVPTAAVVSGQEGSFVYVVGADRTVEKRPVKVNRDLDGVTVIDEGLKAGETVVTDGQMRLVPGALVEFKPQLPKKGSAQ